jgi:hypothetical protein
MNWKPYHTEGLKKKHLLKFVPFKRLKDFIKSGEIWFSRADEFGDKMECIKISDFQNSSFNYKQLKERQKKILISCWHLADTESVAMWDTHSKKEEERKNFAIRFERNTLTELINNSLTSKNSLSPSYELIHGKVQYKNLINYKENRLSKAKIKYAAFRKENAFNYESEYRFVLKDIKKHTSKGLGYIIGNPKDLTFDILINPLLKSELANKFKNEIHELGFDKNIKESQLNMWFLKNEK